MFLSLHQETVRTTLSCLKQNNRSPPRLQRAAVPEDQASLLHILGSKLTLPTNYRNKKQASQQQRIPSADPPVPRGAAAPAPPGYPASLAPHRELPRCPRGSRPPCTQTSVSSDVSPSRPSTHLQNRAHRRLKDAFQICVHVKELQSEPARAFSLASCSRCTENKTN